MNAPLALALWLALVMPSCCGATGTGSEEEEEELPTTTSYYYHEYEDVTGTPDYDYNATFDYYFVTGPYESRSKASAIGRLTPELLLGLAVLQMWH